MSIQLFSTAGSSTASSSTKRPGTVGIVAEPAHYGYIDALRGVAILGVFVVHSSQHISDLPDGLLRVCSAGQFGVQLFFVLSALTLLLSLHGRHQEKQNRVRNFYVRRLFRIVPMFWFGILLYNYTGLHPNHWSPGGIQVWQVLITFGLVHGWYPTSLNSVVPGGWSIAVETTFYGVFPLLAVWLRDKKRVLAALFFLVLLVNPVNRFLFDLMTPFWQGQRAPVLNGFFNWWFPSQLPVFLVGFLLYYRVKSLSHTSEQPGSRRRAAWLCVLGAGLLIALLVHGSPLQTLILSKTRTSSLLSLAYAAAFFLLVYGLALVPFRLFVNRFFRYLGLVSFSGYIDHFLVLDKEGKWIDAGLRHCHLVLSPCSHYALLCSLALPSTIALATVTYRLIETPGISLGKKLIGYLDARSARSAGGAPGLYRETIAD